MVIWILFFLLGWSSSASAEVEDVYLWKRHSLIDKTISVPHPLIITSYTKPVSLDVFQRVNGFLRASYLDGGRCSINKGKYFSKKVKGIIAPNTPLTVIKVFHVLKNLGLFEKFIMKLIDFKGGPEKVGPELYYLVRDLNSHEFIVASGSCFYTYGSPGSKKAARIISDFTGKNKGIQRVLLTFELSKDFDEKCGYGYPKGQEPKRINPKEEMKMLIEQALQFIETYKSSYAFQDIIRRSNQIEMDVGDKALAFLLLNSSPLRIKDISLVD